ncbi:MAG: YbhB/YbcL family Raf kinase inhibitor-like protein [Actinomycetota bacterium]
MCSAISKKWFAIALVLSWVVFLLGCSSGIESSNTASDKTPAKQESTRETVAGGGNMKLFSGAFSNNGFIPAKYARDGVAGGQNISIPLNWKGAPAGTKSFALVMVDISARNFVHWMVVNIPSGITYIGEGASGKNMPPGSIELLNSFGTSSYGGPQPPPGSGVHDYVTTVYALEVGQLTLPDDSSYDDFLQAIEGKVLDKASIIGKFSR